MKTLRLVRAVLMFALALESSNALHAQVTIINVGHVTNSVAGEMTQSVVVSGNYAYVTEGEGGLAVYDVSNPAMPVAVAQTNANSNSYSAGLVVSNNLAYVTRTISNTGFNVYDVSDPANPKNTFSTNLNLLSALTVDGTNLYLGGNSNLLVFNISTPSAPVLVTNASVARSPGNLTIGSNFMVGGCDGYIVTGFLSNGLYTANLLSTPIPGHAGPVAVQGQYAFLPFQSSFHTYLISATGPKLVAQLNYPSNTVGVVAVSGSYAYFGLGDGVGVINISNPTNLVPAGQTTANSYGTIAVYDIAVSGPYAYVANGQDGLRVFEIIPSLCVSQSGGNLLFSWPATSSFALQQRSLTDTNWVTLTNLPVLVNGTNQLSLSPSGAGAFYRLISM